ncbi:hypothetical protein diail_1764 [Diaporthe ilicicola]|nr:hypothetical protein diail_1764 [Diaporthe ilicicola]
MSLRRAGHAMRIYERSSFSDEVGAAINVPPTASLALLAWGLDPERAKFVTVKSSFRANAKTLERFHVGTTEGEFPVKYGSPWYFAHRVDLHEELKSPGGWLQRPTGRDAEAPSITLADGETVHGDVVIAADGIHTLGVEAIINDRKAKPSRAIKRCV